MDIVTLIIFFLHTTSLLAPYAYTSMESTDCSFILLTSSVNALYFSLVNLCCDVSINLLFLYEFFLFSLRLSSSRQFFLVDLFYSQVDLLSNNTFNLQI